MIYGTSIEAGHQFCCRQDANASARDGKIIARSETYDAADTTQIWIINCAERKGEEGVKVMGLEIECCVLIQDERRKRRRG